MLSVAQVAERCGVSKDTVRRLIDGGKLPAFKVGGQIRVEEDALAAYLEQARVGGERERSPRRRASNAPRRPARRGSLMAMERRAA